MVKDPKENVGTLHRVLQHMEDFIISFLELPRFAFNLYRPKLWGIIIKRPENTKYAKILQLGSMRRRKSSSHDVINAVSAPRPPVAVG